MEETIPKNDFVNETQINLKLTEIKYWPERLKFKTNFKFYFILFAFLPVSYLTIIEPETLLDSLFTYINLLLIYILALYLNGKIPEMFQELIDKNQQKISRSDDVGEEYNDYVSNIFTSPLERYIPLICAILYSLISVYLYGFNRDFFGYMELKSGTTVYFEGLSRVIYTIHTIIVTGYNFIIITIAISTVFIIFFNLICIDKLGSEDYSININYRDLKAGTLKSFGKWAISIIIPPIVLCTSLSATGFFYLIFYDAVVQGYFMMITGIIIALIAVILLFKITYDLRKTIVNCKKELKKELEVYLPTNFDKNSIDFVELGAKKNLYESIDEIENWPFDLSTVKKLFLTFATSILPLLLSILKQFYF
jgi:hypothetical protein